MRFDELFIKAFHGLPKKVSYRKMVMTILRLIPVLVN
jgi:hypothetical protein